MNDIEKKKIAKERSAIWRSENKDRARKASADYCVRHREEQKAYSASRRILKPKEIRICNAAYQSANPEKVKAWQAKWREKSTEKIREYQQRYQTKYPEKRRIISHNYRARKNSNGGKLSKDVAYKLLMLQHSKCAICKKNLKKTGFHLDHVVPLARGGKNIDANIQLTCPKCNTSKGSKDPIMFMQEMGYLL